jgi:hypothetical protein
VRFTRVWLVLSGIPLAMEPTLGVQSLSLMLIETTLLWNDDRHGITRYLNKFVDVVRKSNE